MIDRFAYTAMTGAKHAMGQLATTTQNLANTQTPGFREMFTAFRSVPVDGQGADTRAFVVDSTPGSDFTQGVIQTTGNPYDVAIKNAQGFFAVRRPDGSEAYTRSGRFTVDQDGILRLGKNEVLGQVDNITIPVETRNLEISQDGTISTQFVGNTAFDEASKTPFSEIDKLRLVNIDPKLLVRSEDGLFSYGGIERPDTDPTLMVQQGAVELSNVNPTTAMVQMIEQNRLFDLNMRFIQAADQNSKSANSLMSLSRG